MQEWVGLLDCNNFFVSCERLFRPDLKRRPVAVLSSNDGCVVARSKEIKDSGIPMGVPYFQIKDIIKDIDGVTFSSHFALYRDISRRVFEAMRMELEVVEQYSVDEAFFVIKAEERELQEVVNKVKDRVEREVGIPVSIGVASSKTQAKYASSLAKKTNGICILSPAHWQAVLSEVKLADLWGVGKQLADTYKRHKLLTVQDLMRLKRGHVESLFGVVGVRLWLELHGTPAITVSRKSFVKQSILHSRSFKHTTTDVSVLHDAVAYHIREAAEDLRAQGLKTKGLQVSLGTSRHSDYFLKGGSLAYQFETPTDDTFLLIKTAVELVNTLYTSGVPYKKAGILLFNLTSVTLEQLTMFAQPEVEKTKHITPMIDSINKQIGKGSVLVGSRLKTKDWQSSQESRSPAYTTAWKDIAIVKA
jgi:DNA polymerase V